MSGHEHDHGGSSRGRLGLALGITVVVLVADVVGAAASGSLALLADAGHVLGDAAGLTLALVAALLADRPVSDARTWGYRRAEVLAAAGQAALLLVVSILVVVEAVRHLVDPPAVAAGPMLAFAVVGLAGNLAAVAVLAGARRESLNTRAAFLEVTSDALASAAVVAVAVLIAVSGVRRADAVASLLIGLLIAPRAWQLLRESVDILLESTPAGIDLADVRAHLLEVEHVIAVHDLHASVIASRLPTLTAHVVVEDGCFLDGHAPQILDEVQSCLAGHFDVEHSTFQFEPASHATHEHAHP